MSKSDSSLSLSDYLRSLLRNEHSLRAVALAVGIPQPTLNDFAYGRSDGSYSDLRLSAAEKLMEFYGLKIARSNRKVGNTENRTMRLSRELKAADVTMSEDDFKKYLISWLIEWFEGRTIDSLVCEPKDAKEYCRLVREAAGSEKLIDYVILKALMNIRRAKKCPKDLCPRRKPVYLESIIADFQLELTPEQYEAILVDAMPGVCKNKTVDDLCCYADQALDFCERVRRKLRCPQLPSSAMLRPLMNYRKTKKRRKQRA